ncbi:MAG: transglycosylase domain-containing protein [Anaerolineales bacterium]|nr:transglycosylase domain-containing protein [Anaerolineales bacterium]
MRKIPGRFRTIRELREAKPSWLTRAGGTVLIFSTVAVLLFSITVFLIGLEYSSLAAAYPAVSRIETYFGSPGSGVFIPTRFYDNTGTFLLYEAVHPNASSRQWLGFGADDSAIPDLVVQATLSFQPDAFVSPGLLDGVVGVRSSVGDRFPSIAEQLLQVSLHRSSSFQTEHLLEPWIKKQLIYDLQSSYSEEQLLEWYLNAAYYGNMAYGFDAAGLVYFGKHAQDLSLAEITMLAPLPLNPSANPVDNPVNARAAQEKTLRAMVSEGYISRQEARLALSEPIDLQQGIEESVPAGLAVFWQALVQEAPDIERRIGMIVTTSIDLKLQQQAACAALQITRLAGGGTLEAIDPSCQADQELMPVLSSMLEQQPDIDKKNWEPAWMIADPQTGMVLSFGGDIQRSHPLGSAIDPVFYLAAYAYGSSPSTMVIDLPDGRPDTDPPHTYAGPVRMRTALKNGYPGARQQVVDLVGMESIAAIAQQLGLSPWPSSAGEQSPRLFMDTSASLLQIAQIHAVWANDGRSVGAAAPETKQGASSLSGLNPVFINTVEDVSGSLFSTETNERFVVSRQLAFLLSDSLRSTNYEYSEPGYPSEFSNHRWATHLGATEDGAGWWVMGFSPDYVVGVWMDGQVLPQSLSKIDGTPPVVLWDALAAVAAGSGDIGTWDVPPGLEWVEVCDPSGLLPTADCPLVVEEVFISGSAPQAYDNLYQRIQVHRETGRLATVYTLESEIEEKLVLTLPMEAQQWGGAAGFTRIPETYETIRVQDLQGENLRITTPQPFQMVSGNVSIAAIIESSEYVSSRILFGAGLNPNRWTLLKEQQLNPQQEKISLVWDTGTLSGLYILQAALQDESNHTTFYSIPVLVDNSPPQAAVTVWTEDLDVEGGDVVVLEISAEDNYGISRVELFLDGEELHEWAEPPYELRLTVKSGVYELYASVMDTAGQTSTSETITLHVE